MLLLVVLNFAMSIMLAWFNPWRLLCIFLVPGLWMGPVSAAPMGFKDSTMLMVEVDKDEKDVSVNHALTARDAVGVSAHDLRVHGVHHGQAVQSWQTTRQLTYTRRAMRWNLPEAQANVWLFAAAGQIKHQVGARHDTQTVWTPGFQLDYETTRVYSALSGRFHHADDLRQQTWVARGGFSFYETNYDEVQPWLILEAKHVSRLTSGVDWTPMLRFIHKRYFLELGVSESGNARLSIMFNY